MKHPYASSRLRVAQAMPVLAALCAALALPARAVPVHVINGQFDANEWTVSGSNPSPARSTVVIAPFTVNGVANGAYLHTEQSQNGDPPAGTLGNKLELLYECVVCTGPSLPGNGAMDIFFGEGDHDYVVHIFGTVALPSFSAFEKSKSASSPLNLDGTLDLSSPVWSALSAADLALAQFQVAMGFGSSVHSASDHFFAEFQLSVNTAGPGQPPNGQYSPDPNFWSASVRGFSGVSAVGSGTFRLNSDGSTTVTPVLGANGEAIIQPLPEPGSLALALLALTGLGWAARRR